MTRSSAVTARDQQRADLFGSVFMLVQYLTRRADEALEPLGVTTKQWLLLAVLTKRFAGGAPTLTEVAEVYGSSRQNVKQIATQLQERGYLRLESDTADRRVVRLRLLPKVAAFDAPAQRARHAAFFDQLYAGLSAAEVRTLQHLVRRWLAHVSPV